MENPSSATQKGPETQPELAENQKPNFFQRAIAGFSGYEKLGDQVIYKGRFGNYYGKAYNDLKKNPEYKARLKANMEALDVRDKRFEKGPFGGYKERVPILGEWASPVLKLPVVSQLLRFGVPLGATLFGGNMLGEAVRNVPPGQLVFPGANDMWAFLKSQVFNGAGGLADGILGMSWPGFFTTLAGSFLLSETLIRVNTHIRKGTLKRQLAEKAILDSLKPRPKTDNNNQNTNNQNQTAPNTTVLPNGVKQTTNPDGSVTLNFPPGVYNNGFGAYGMCCYPMPMMYMPVMYVPMMYMMPVQPCWSMPTCNSGCYNNINFGNQNSPAQQPANNTSNQPTAKPSS